MTSIATIMATAAFSVGAVAAIKRLQARRARGRDRGERIDPSVVDLQDDGATGVWRMDRTQG